MCPAPTEAERTRMRGEAFELKVTPVCSPPPPIATPRPPQLSPSPALFPPSFVPSRPRATFLLKSRPCSVPFLSPSVRSGAAESPGGIPGRRSMQRHMHARAFAPGCAIVVLAVAGFARAETPDLIEVTENNVLRWDI